MSIAILCGTDLRQYQGLELGQSVSIDSEYGDLSSEVYQSSAFDQPVYFMARHGTQTTIAPHQINYRANIDALAKLDVKQIIAVNTVGGLLPSTNPGRWVIPEQIIDYTHSREQTFFDSVHKPMKHIDFSFPFAGSLRDSLIEFAQQQSRDVLATGVYGVTQGPRLETAAEIKRLQQDGCSLVGMTMMPEAVLAREADIGYCSLCLVANWGAGMEEKPLDIDDIYKLVKSGFTDMVSFLSDYLKQI